MSGKIALDIYIQFIWMQVKTLEINKEIEKKNNICCKSMIKNVFDIS